MTGTPFRQMIPATTNTADREYMFMAATRRQAREAAKHPAVTETPELTAKADALVQQFIATHAFIPAFSEMEGGQRQYWLQRAAA